MKKLLIPAAMLLAASCLTIPEYETHYVFFNDSDVDLVLVRHSGAEGLWDRNFADSIDSLALPDGGRLNFSYLSEGGVLLPFGATDSLVLTDLDSIRVVYTPMTEGRNPFWPTSYQGGFISEIDKRIFHEYIFYLESSDLGLADTTTAGQ